MLKKLRRHIKEKRERPEPARSLVRKIRFEALESRFLLSAEIAIPPPDPNLDNAYHLELEQIQTSQTLILEEQQQIRILELDPGVTITEAEPEKQQAEQAEAETTVDETSAEDDAGTSEETANNPEAAVTETSTAQSPETALAARAPPAPANHAPLMVQQVHEIIFVDSGVEDYRGLLDDLIDTPQQQAQASSDNVVTARAGAESGNAPDSSTQTDEDSAGLLALTGDSSASLQSSDNLASNTSFINDNTLVVVLDADRDGIDQITEVLQSYQGVAAVHILSHGSNANVRLGNASLNSAKLQQYSDRLKAWGRALTPDGDILLYGCNVANGSAGVAFVQDLGELTGADIAASNDDTGGAALGGDWEFESTVGLIEATPIFTASTANNYLYLLADIAIAGTDNADTFDIDATKVDSTDYSMGDNVEVNTPAPDGTIGDDTFDFTNFPAASSFDVYGGAGIDTLDFSSISTALTYVFNANGSVTVSDATNELTASNIETIKGGSSANNFQFAVGASFAGSIQVDTNLDTLDFSSVTDNLTFTFDSSGNLVVSGGSIDLSASNIETIEGGVSTNDFIFLQDAMFAGALGGGTGDNNFTFSAGVTFTGNITGNGTDTFDFINYTADDDDTTNSLTFSGNTITNSETVPTLNIIHTGIDNVDVNFDKVVITDAVAATLSQGLGDLVDWTAKLQEHEEIGFTLSGLTANEDVNLGDALDIDEAFDQLRLQIESGAMSTAQDIADSIFGFDQTGMQKTDSTIDELGELKVETVGAVTPILSFVDDAPELVFSFNYLATRTTDFTIDLGKEAEDIGIVFDDKFTLLSELDADLGLGLKLKEDPAPGSDFFFNLDRFELSATADDIETAVSGSLNIDVGFLAALADGTANLKAAVETDPDQKYVDLESDPGFDVNKIGTQTDFDLALAISVPGGGTVKVGATEIETDTALTFSNEGNAGKIVRSSGSWSGINNGDDITVSGTLYNDGNYSVAAVSDKIITLAAGNKLTNEKTVPGLDSFEDLTITLMSGDPFEGRDIESIDFVGFGADNLGKFSEFNAATFVSQVGTVRDWFGSVKDSDIFKSVDIPFVTSTLDKVFNLGDAVGDTLLYDQGGDGKDDGATLVVDLRQALDDANLTDKIRVEGDGSKLALIALDSSISDITVSNGSDIGFDASESFANNKLVANGAAMAVLAKDVTFILNIVENGKAKEYSVAITQDSTANNETIGNDQAKLLDENNAATFKSAQDLANKLFEIIGIDENVTAAYDKDTKRLTFELTFNPLEYELAVPVDFNFDLSPIGNIGTAGSPDITLGAGIDISLTLGLDLSDKPAGTKDLTESTRLIDLNGIDSLDDAIKTEAALSPENVPTAELDSESVDISFVNAGAEMTGNPQLVFTDNGDSDTIQRINQPDDGATWRSDGFVEGQQITVTGSVNNNGTYTIAEILDNTNTLELTVTDELAEETKSGVKLTGAAATMTESPKLHFNNIGDQGQITRLDGSWKNDGFKEGDYIVIEGAGENNGVYQIESIVFKSLTLVSGTSFTPENDVENVTITVPDRIKINAGSSWETAEFKVGQLISVSGTQLNNRTFLTAGLSDDGMTLFLSPDAKVSNEHLDNAQESKDAPALKIIGGPIIRLSADAEFSIDGTTVSVLAQPDGPDGDRPFVSATSDNKNLLDLVSDINSAIADAELEGRVQAELSNGKILLTSEDGNEFQLNNLNDPARDELGFGTPQEPEPDSDPADLLITLTDESQYRITLDGVETIGDVIDRIHEQTIPEGETVSVVKVEIDPDTKAGLRLTQAPALTGNPRLTFDSTGNAIAREDGKNWADDQFSIGQIISVYGADQNNEGVYTVSDIVDIDGKNALIVSGGTLATNQQAVKDIRITLAGSEIFRVEALNGSKIASKLGILSADVSTDVNEDGKIDFNDGDGIINGDAIAGASVLDRFFIQDPTVQGNVSVETPDGIEVVGDFGFVAVGLNGDGYFDTTLTLGLDDPTPDLDGITVNELIKSLKHINSIVSTPTIGGPKVSDESLKFDGNTIVRTNNEAWKDFEAGEYISISGASEQNNGHFKIADNGVNGSILTLDLDQSFKTETISDAMVLNQIGSFSLGVEVQPDFGLINEAATETRVVLFDFGNPFVETDFKQDQFTLDESKKVFVLDGEGDEDGNWADRIDPGAGVVAELEALTFDAVGYIDETSFSLAGDQSDTFELGAKVTVTLAGDAQAISKIKTINYDEDNEITTFTVQDNVLTDPVSSVSIATEDVKTKVVSVSYDEGTNKTTITVVDEVLTASVSSLSVDTPRALDYLFDLPDLGSLVSFDSIGISEIIDGLIALSDFLDDYESFGFLSEPIPIIDISVNDVLSFADRFDAAVHEAQNNPAGTLQVLEDKLKEALGIPSGIDSDALGFTERQSSDTGALLGNEDVGDVSDLTHDIVFLLSLNNGPSQLIKVSHTDSNGAQIDTIDKLVTNVNSALTASFGTKVTAAKENDKIKFTTSDNKSLAISNPIDFSIYEDGDLQMLRMDFGLGTGFTQGLDVSFNLGGNNGILSGAAGLEASGAIDFNLSLGIDLNNPTDADGNVNAYIFDSDVTGQLEAIGEDIAFRAGIGPLGVFINEGLASIGGDIGGVPGEGNGNKLFTFGLDFDDNPNNEAYKLIADVDLGSDFAAELAGSINANLPVYFPTDTLHKGAVLFNADLSVNDSGFFDSSTTLSAVDPDGNPIDMGDLFTFDLSELTLMDNMLLAVDGIDAFLGGLQDVLDGEVFGVPLPLVGDKLADGARFIEDLRDDFIDPFRDEIENLTEQDENIISELLFDLLGPAGIGLLMDNNDDNLITINDVILDTNVNEADGDLQNDYMQWNMQLGQTLNLGSGIGLDLGIPGLALETRGDVNLELGWNLDFGFGISFDEAFYLDIADGSELETTLEVTLPDFGITGELAFLQLDGQGNKDASGKDISHFTANFGVDVYNKDTDNDKRLAFSELGSIGLEAGISGEAIVDLNFVLKLDSALAPGIAGVFPKIETDFLLDWSLDDNPGVDGLQLVSFSDLSSNLVKDGLNIVAFQDVSLDLGSFIGDFIDPILGTVKDVVEPVQPIIDFLTSPLPVISDLGPELTVLDLAKLTGKVDTGFIESIAEMITLINAIPTDPASTYINFGEFVIFDKSKNPELDITDPAGDVKNNVEAPTDSEPMEDNRTDSGSPTDGQKKTKTFKDKINAAGDFSFPILNDPTQIFNLLLGKDAVLMTFDLKPLSIADFSYKQSFPVYPPLFVAIIGEIGLEADFAFGFDTLGISQFADSGFRNPALIFNGFYISDTDIPTGEFGTDVPELTLSGGFGAAVELNLGIASAGVGGGIFLDVFFDLFDPNHDGRVRVPELANSIINEFRYGSPAFAPLALFDVSGEVYAQLFAYIEFLFFGIDFDITPPITLVEFDIPFTRVPTLATDIGDGILQLNMGEFAAQRLNNNTTDGDETFTITGSGKTVHVSATFGGTKFKQTYENVEKILALAGEGNDVIDLRDLDSSTITFELDGGVGNDRILLSDKARGSAVITGGVGDDVITGGKGDDEIYGGAGNDIIEGGMGDDTIFGDEGEIAFLDNGEKDYTRARVKVTDGDDVIYGGEGNDLIFGGGGEDEIRGDAGNDFIVGDGAILRDQLTITARNEAGGDEEVKNFNLTGDALLEFIIDGETVVITLSAGDYADLDGVIEAIDHLLGTDEDIDGRISAESDEDATRLQFRAVEDEGVLEFRIKGANDIAVSELGLTSFFKKVAVLDDINRGDGKADTLYGNEGDDVIYGGRGDDLIEGNEHNDKLYGGDGFDAVYGNAGDDRLFGGNENDQLSGGAGDDHIEGGAGHDRIWGDWMVDEVVAGIAGVDSIWGDTGADTIFGGAKGDFLFGGSDPDLIFGESGNDTIDGGHGADKLFGGVDNDTITSSLGDDFIDGESGSDQFIINTMGGDISSLVTIFDSGSTGDGTDKLTVNGTEGADRFLLRASNVPDGDLNKQLTAIQEELESIGVVKNLILSKEEDNKPRSFIASLNNEDNVERINFYDNLESIVVNTLGDDDQVVSDNTIAEVQINGGDGDDLFQVGQIFNAPRDTDAGIDEFDVFDTVQTTKGFLSNGINAPMTINGEDGNDSFVVFRNLKVLSLNGGDGDDEFLVKAFALEGSVDDPDRDLTDITGAGGADLIQYAVNAPVGINGGDGLDTVIVLGTEFGDDFVLTDQGVFGAGLNVNFAGIEVLKLDAAEGNDRIFVLGTGADHITEVFAGEGSDAFFIGGDTPPIVSQDLLGHSGIITQQASSGDPRFDGVNVDGISANVGDNDEAFIRIIKDDGMLRVTEDGTVVATYSLVLTREPRGKVFVTALSQTPSPNEVKNGVEYLRVFNNGSILLTDMAISSGPDSITGSQTIPDTITDDKDYKIVITEGAGAGQIRTITAVDGAFLRVDSDWETLPDTTSRYIIVSSTEPVMVFDSDNWFIPQTFGVMATPDLAYEGKHIATINHLVKEVDQAGGTETPITDAPTYHEMAIPSVNVEIIDDDQPGLVIQQSDGSTRVIEGADFGAAAPFADEYTIRLNQQPDSDVTVTLVNGDGQVQFEQDTFIFTAQNWNTAQTVRVIAADDRVNEGFHHGYIQHVVSSDQDDVIESVTDETFEATIEAEARSSVLLDYAPIDKAAITKVELIDAEGTSTVLDDPNHYSIDDKRLTILGKDGLPLKVTDQIIVSYSYTRPGFQNVDTKIIGVEIGDNDAPGVLVLQSGGSTNVIEVGDTILGKDAAPFTDQYQVVLTARPDADVVIDVTPQPTKTSNRPPFSFSADAGNVAVSELGFAESSDPTISITSGEPAPENGQLGGDLVFSIDLTPDDDGDAAVQVTLGQDEMAGYQSIDDLISGINSALKDAGLEEKIFAIRDENRVVIAKVPEPLREQVTVSASTLTFTPDNWNIPQSVTVTAINDDVVDGGESKTFAPAEQTLARIQGPLIINGAGGNGSDAGLGADPFRLPGESNDVGNVVEVPAGSEGNVLANQVVLDSKDTDKLGPSYFKSLDTFESGDEDDDTKAKVIIRITSGPGEGQERVVVARNQENNQDIFILAEDWDTDNLPNNESSYIFIRELARVNEAEQVDVATVFHIDSLADNIGSLTATRLYGLGMGPDMELDGLTWPGGITYTDLENLTVHMGGGNDTLDIYGAQNRDDFRTVTIVNTGAGDDDVTVDIEADTGIVTSGNVLSSRTKHLQVQDENASFPTEGRGLSGYLVRVTDADSNVQERTILFNDADTLYLNEAWENLPQAGDQYEIVRLPAGLLSVNGQAGNDELDASSSTAKVILFGGLGDEDILMGGEGDDILMGDRGQIDYIDDDGNLVTRLGSNDIPAPLQENPDDPDDPIVIFKQTDGVFRDPAIVKSIDPESGGNDRLHGGGGNDLLIGGASADQLFGDGGDDVLIGDGGQIVPPGTDNGNNKTLYKSTEAEIGGDDTLQGGDGNDLLIGGAMADQLFGDAGDDVLIGDGGQTVPPGTDNGTNKTLYKSTEAAIGGDDTLHGGDGNDLLIGGAMADQLFGEAGDDVLIGDGGQTVPPGTDNGTNKTLYKSTEAAIGGDDTLRGGAGNDLLIGGAKADELFGDAGDDVLIGDGGQARPLDTDQANNETLIKSTEAAIGGDDTLHGGDGNDLLIGGAMADQLFGDAGDDVLIGDGGQANPLDTDSANNKILYKSTEAEIGGDDTLRGGGGNDLLIGGAKADQLFGDAADDVLIGDGGQLVSLGTNHIYYETIDNFIGGNDALDGGPKNDIMFGGFGDDEITGSFSEDLILGEYGRVTLKEGKVEFLLRLGQGPLDLAASSLFTLYTIDPLETRALPVRVSAAEFVPAEKTDGTAEEVRYGNAAAAAATAREGKHSSHNTPQPGVGVPVFAPLPPPPGEVPGYHMVEQNDTLWSMAESYLGDGERWREIWALNPQLKDPNRILPGMQLKLPEQNSNSQENNNTEETAPALQEFDVQGTNQFMQDDMSAEQLALASLGLLGLRSPQAPRGRQPDAARFNLDGAFVFDQVRGQLQPYYLGYYASSVTTDTEYQAEQLGDVEFMTGDDYSFAELEATSETEEPVIEWGGSYSSRPVCH